MPPASSGCYYSCTFPAFATGHAPRFLRCPCLTAGGAHTWFWRTAFPSWFNFVRLLHCTFTALPLRGVVPHGLLLPVPYPFCTQRILVGRSLCVRFCGSFLVMLRLLRTPPPLLKLRTCRFRLRLTAPLPEQREARERHYICTTTLPPLLPPLVWFVVRSLLPFFCILTQHYLPLRSLLLPLQFFPASSPYLPADGKALLPTYFPFCFCHHQLVPQLPACRWDYCTRSRVHSHLHTLCHLRAFFLLPGWRGNPYLPCRLFQTVRYRVPLPTFR